MFEGNDAIEGGAIYVDSIASLDIANSAFRGNVADVGGAISACAKNDDSLCIGTISLADVVGERNVARFPDDLHAEGGGFMKVNGGVLALRDVRMAGNLAGNEPSAIGMRYTDASFHRVSADGRIRLHEDGQLKVFCSDALQIEELAQGGRQSWTVTDDADECSLCLPGLAWNAPEYACVECPAGRHKLGGDTACERCDGGSRSYQDESGQASCKRCHKNEKATDGHTDCEDLC